MANMYETNVAEPTVTPATQTPNCSMNECVERSLANYFSQLGTEKPHELYDMVLGEVERPLLEAMMAYTKGNQSKAAIYLGISRGTLRKKLKIYNLD